MENQISSFIERISTAKNTVLFPLPPGEGYTRKELAGFVMPLKRQHLRSGGGAHLEEVNVIRQAASRLNICKHMLASTATLPVD